MRVQSGQPHVAVLRGVAVTGKMLHRNQHRLLRIGVRAFDISLDVGGNLLAHSHRKSGC